jgi:ribose transport system permease protein
MNTTTRPDVDVVVVPDPPVRRPTRHAARLWNRFLQSNLWLLVVLGVMALVFSLLAPHAFPTLDNVRNIAFDAAVLLILAVGMTFVIITAGIDIAVGAVLIFAGVVSARVMSEVHAPVAVLGVAGLAAGVVSGLAWGLLHGVLVAKAKLPSLIVTLGSLGMAQGFALLLTDNGTDITNIPPGIVDNVGNARTFGDIPVLVWIAIAVAIVGGGVLAWTKFGRHVYAIGSNQEAARRAGILVTQRLITVYAISGGLAGLAGFLSVIRFSTTSVSGHAQDSLQAITAVVLGGTSLFGGVGTMIGTVLGVLIPSVLQNGLVISGLEPFWQQVAVGAVLIVAVLADQFRRRNRYRGND